MPIYLIVKINISIKLIKIIHKIYFKYEESKIIWAMINFIKLDFILLIIIININILVIKIKN